MTSLRPNPLWPDGSQLPFIPEDIMQFQGGREPEIVGNPFGDIPLASILINKNLPEAHSMNLTQMAADVAEVNRSKGWYEASRDFDTDIALIHTEISEAFEAYRLWKFEDATGQPAPGMSLAKPEGVGSELADVLIRFLDTAERYSWDLADLEAYEDDLFIEDVAHAGTFTKAINGMHHLAAIMAYNQATAEEVARRFYGMLLHTAAFAEVDLDAEYVRKLAYNRTRGHRHGGKLV